MVSIILRTIFFYFYVTFIYRLMGKREIGQLSLIDLVVSILIAELGAISIENYKDSIFYTIIPITLLTLLEILIAFIKLRNRKIGRFFEGKPTVLVNEGKIIYSNLEKERYSLDDLLRELRLNNIYRFQITIKYRNDEKLFEALKYIDEQYAFNKDVNIEIDVNPLRI